MNMEHLQLALPVIVQAINIIALSWALSNVPEIIGLIKTNFNIWALLKALFTCLKCITFWVALIITYDIYTASILSFIALQVDTYLNKPLEL